MSAGATTINETIESTSAAGEELVAIEPGTGCGVFTFTPDEALPRLVRSSDALPVTITFNPATRGAVTCNVRLVGLLDATLGTVQLTGTGIAPEVSVPASTSFGTVPIASGSATTNVVITNNGEQTLTINALSITGAGYTINSPTPPANITAGNALNVNITFDPSTAGPNNATLSISSNDPITPMASAGLTGVGSVAPGISGPASVAFGNVDVGTTSGAMPLTITNTGDATLTITSAVVQTGDYAATGTAGMQTVPAGGMATWMLTCTPLGQDARPGTFRILSDAPGANTLDVPLTCNGTRGFLEVDPTTLAFGSVPQDATSTLSVLLKNTGNLPVNGITATITPNNVGYTIVGAVPATLAANTNATVQVRFAPTATAAGGNANILFQGTWGTTPSATMATLAVTGTRLTVGYTVSTPTLAFGDFRYDLTPTRTFCIENTGQSPVTIQSPMSFVPSGGTASNEFVVAGIKKQATCGSAGTTVVLPQTLATGEILEVTVRAQPANRTGPLTGDLQITSNLPSNPNRTVALSGNSITAMLTVTPGSTVDFGNVDIQGAPAMVTVRLRNTGAAPLDLGSFTRTANAAFTFTLPATQTVAPNGEAMFVVTYAPTVALAADETVTITHSIAGDIALPATGMIVLRGRPTDRDLSVIGGNPIFPDTFRNPGTLGPVRTVSIRNTGTAPLQIASVTSSDPDVWKVLDADAITVPPAATMDIRVRFEPTGPGRSDERLLIVNDDDDDGPPITQKTTEVALAGNCVDRRVSFNPTTINVGYVEIGETYTIDEALVVRSMDEANAFKITRIDVAGGDGAFTVDGATNITLDRIAMERRFDVTFTPTTAGPITAKAQLFLDEDPVHQSEIELTGTAVFVDARGGGGCATGHAGGLGAIVLVLLIVLRRRRAATLVVAIAVAPIAQADDNVLLSVFEPTPQTMNDGFQLQSPVIGAHGAFAGHAVFSYASDPLLHLASTGTEHGVITGSSMLELGVAVALLGKFELGAAMPFYSQTGEELGDRNMGYTTAPADGTATGDLRVNGKVAIYQRLLDGGGSFALAGSIGLTLPTATDGMLAGVDDPSARILAIAALVPGAFSNRLTISTNLGAVVRAAAEYKNLEQKSGVMWGLGTSVRVADPLWITGEMFGEFVPSGREKMDGSSTLLAPIEWLAGLRWKPDRRFMVSVAAGRGLTSAAGAPALRGVVALTVTPRADAIKPLHAPPPPKPDTDNDGDGIVDRLDKCPNEVEDVDVFEDSDGCPDFDNDADGVADANDRCPMETEDKDGFQDDDGCIEKDNDNDLILDVMDKCPNEAEDQDGFQDADGCNEPDNDGDGILDLQDKCPAQKETINGNQDDDGCPDKGISLVLITLERIDLMESIQFTKEKIKPASYNLLGQIGATLRAHPEILRVRVAVHVGATNAKDELSAQQLSDKRAQALREWLVQWGVADKRLEVRGFGSTKPLGGSAAADERVEIVIMEKK
ncbi:MAG: choice-of-anchor D domain-containing protein [Myxococcota bacterium]|nr:choice-of-anchor D domain-containing protein [Myxococcota bacterium]